MRLLSADYSDSFGVSSEVSVSAPLISGSVTLRVSVEEVGSSTGGVEEVAAFLAAFLGAAFLAAFFGAAFLATAFFTGAAFLAAFTAFLGAAFLAALTAFLGAAFLAAFTAFLGAAFFGAAFFGAAFFGAAFLGAAFFGAAFLGAAFLVAILFRILRLEMLLKFTQAKCIPKLISENQINKLSLFYAQ